VNVRTETYIFDACKEPEHNRTSEEEEEEEEEEQDSRTDNKVRCVGAHPL